MFSKHFFLYHRLLKMNIKIILTFYYTGYSALFRHPNDELNYCVYIIPGNPNVTPEHLSYWHDNLMKNDPNISKALGDNFRIERMKAGK